MTFFGHMFNYTRRNEKNRMIFGRYINKYYLKYAPVLLFGIAALLAVDYAQLKIPELYQLVVNGINGNAVTLDGTEYAFDMDFVLEYICKPMLIIIAVMIVGRFMWRVCFFGSGIRVETDLRGKMFDRCKDLSAQYYQVNKVGNMMSLYTNDLESINDSFGWGTMMMCDALFMGTLSVIKMFRMDSTLTLFALIPMAFLLAGGFIVGNNMEKKWDLRQQAYSDLSDFAQESFSGIAVIKAFVKEGKELIAFRWLNKNNEKANVDFVRMSTLLNIIVTLFVESVICVILGYGGYLVHCGSFNAGQLVEFIGYFNAIIWPVMAVSELISMSSKGKASLKRVTELLEAKVDVCDAPDVTPLGDIKGDIEFKHLTFRYPDGEYDALKDVSFKINAGENVGIVGKTGCGKTTLVDLILRVYNVPDGALFIDGVDVNKIPIKEVREACAYVPQDNFLFSDTILNNISFGYDGYSPEKAEEAAKLADVDDDIKGFAGGYSTVLGERGVTVSGGQKQRISIARALMRNSPVLILDDSVSAVDTDTEKKIKDALASTRGGRTTIIIAHRISTIENMDKIIFMGDGKIEAVGTHEELYKSCPDYKKAVDLQKLEAEGEGTANA